MPTRLIELIENLPKATVVLVGDLMLDRYIYANAERLSPEAPVPVLHYQSEEVRLGGAGSVANNLVTLGAQVSVIGVLGDDQDAATVSELLRKLGASIARIVVCPGRPTTCKARLVGSAQHRHPQTMLRLDYENSAAVPDDIAQKIVDNTIAELDGASMLCLEDYNKGVLRADVCQKLIAAARERGVPVIIDPANIPDYSKYSGATCLKLNRTETTKSTGLPVKSPEQFEPAAAKLLEVLNLEAAVVTLDRDGAYLASRTTAAADGTTVEGERRWLRTKARQVYDVTGAGDMVLAMLAVARTAGATWTEAVTLSNIAGGLEVEKFGAVPISPAEILQELLTEIHEHLGKERTIEQLLPELQRHRTSGKRIVFTNGCFDIIHLGHVKYFRFAKSQGDLLVVGVNTDASISRLKGPKRPVIGELDRVGVLEELESIDYLVKFDEDTPQKLIENIRPDVLVKGQDYSKTQVVGWDTVESYGGKVALAPLIDGKSTTSVIQRIIDAYK